MEKSKLKKLIRESVKLKKESINENVKTVNRFKTLAGLNEAEDCKCKAGPDSPCCGKGCCCHGTLSMTNDKGETESWNTAYCCGDPYSGHFCSQSAGLSADGGRDIRRESDYSAFGGRDNFIAIYESILHDIKPSSSSPNNLNEDIFCCPGVGCCTYTATQTDEDGNTTTATGARCCGMAGLLAGQCCPGGVDLDDLIKSVPGFETGMEQGLKKTKR